MENLLTHPFYLEWNDQLYWQFWVFFGDGDSVFVYMCVYTCIHTCNRYIHSHCLYCCFFRDNLQQSSILCNVGFFFSFSFPVWIPWLSLDFKIATMFFSCNWSNFFMNRRQGMAVVQPQLHEFCSADVENLFLAFCDASATSTVNRFFRAAKRGRPKNPSLPKCCCLGCSEW